MAAVTVSDAERPNVSGELVPLRYADALRQISACRRRSDFGADFGIDSSVAAWHEARYAAVIFQCAASRCWSGVIPQSSFALQRVD